MLGDKRHLMRAFADAGITGTQIVEAGKERHRRRTATGTVPEHGATARTQLARLSRSLHTARPASIAALRDGMSRLLPLWWIGLVVVVGCGDSMPQDGGGTNSPPPPGSVLADTVAASATDCPAGGTVVRSGTDDNYNQKLDDGEVRTRTVVCNPEPVKPPPKIVLRIIAEPLGGSACIEGGSAVQSGPDANGNNALDDDEVAHTDLLCGELMVTRFRPEPEGTNCVAGGVAFEVGHDRNGNATLDDGEAEHIDFSCGDLLARSVTITSASDAAALAHIRVIDGDLRAISVPTTGDGAFEAFSLPELQHVSGFVDFVNDPALTTIRLPKLVDIGGSLLLSDDPQLATLDLSLLSSVGRDLTLTGLTALPDMTGAPLLSHAGGNVLILDNTVLANARIPFQVGGAIDVSNNPALAALDLSGSPRLARVTIFKNGITTLTISAGSFLSTDEVGLGPIGIFSNPNLTSVKIFTEALGDVSIGGNPRLEEVHLTFSHGDGNLLIDGPALDQLTLLGRKLDAPVQLAGALNVRGPVTELFAFTSLHVGGDVTLADTQLTRVPSLREVGGSLKLLDNPRLLGLDIPVEVGGSLVVEGNAAIQNVSFVENEVYHGDVVISRNATLVNVQGLGVARKIHGNLDIVDNPALILTGAGQITQVDGNVTVGGNAVLTDLGLDQLQSADLFELNNNPMLSAIALPALQAAGTIIITGNAVAQHLTMPALLRAGSIFVELNPELPSCEVVALQAVTVDPIFQRGNDDTKVCAPIAGRSR